MIRASLLCVLLGAGAALTACDLPPATFNGSGGGAPTTSAAGATGGGGTSTTSDPTTSAGGGGDGTGGSGAAGGTGGSGAAGGTGGTGGSTTTTTTTTTGTGGGPTGPVLQCNFPVVSDCEPGQVCCLDKSKPFEDKCAQPGLCNPVSDYTQASCANDSHCDPGMKCCMNYAYNALSMNWEYSSYCDTACTIDKQEVGACTGDGDCSLPTDTCTAVLGADYSEYMFCWYP